MIEEKKAVLEEIQLAQVILDRILNTPHTEDGFRGLHEYLQNRIDTSNQKLLLLRGMQSVIATKLQHLAAGGELSSSTNVDGPYTITDLTSV